MARKFVDEEGAKRAAHRAVEVKGWCHYTEIEFERGICGPQFDGWIVKMFSARGTFLGLV